MIKIKNTIYLLNELKKNIFLFLIFICNTSLAQDVETPLVNAEERRERIEGDSYFDTLQTIDKKGVHKYSVKASPISANIGLKLGFINPPEIDSRVNYNTIYDYSKNFLILADYEHKLFKKLGHMAIKLGLGLMFARGTGIFAEGINADKQALEKYTLIIAPISVGLNYRLQYWSNQFLSPFVLAGADMFNIMEIRDDGARPNVMSSPSVHFGGGIQITIDSLAGSQVNNLEKEYGVNHMYILAEIRQYIGITTNVNLNNTLFLGGVSFDF